MVGHLLPLLVRQSELSAEVAALRQEMASLRFAASARTASAAVPADTPRQQPRIEATQPGRLAVAVVIVVAASALLHWLLLFVYDAPPMILRILTLLVPLAVGLRVSRSGGGSLAAHGLASACCGIASVAAMLAVTHLIDGVPLLPQDLREMREALEYCASIALAFLTGYLVMNGLHRARQRPLPVASHGALVGYAQRFQQLAGLLSPICAGGLALYSGLKSLGSG
jgi:cation transport ATPase